MSTAPIMHPASVNIDCSDTPVETTHTYWCNVIQVTNQNAEISIQVHRGKCPHEELIMTCTEHILRAGCCKSEATYEFTASNNTIATVTHKLKGNKNEPCKFSLASEEVELGEVIMPTSTCDKIITLSPFFKIRKVTCYFWLLLIYLFIGLTGGLIGFIIVMLVFACYPGCKSDGICRMKVTEIMNYNDNQVCGTIHAVLGKCYKYLGNLEITFNRELDRNELMAIITLQLMATRGRLHSEPMIVAQTTTTI